jgi:hypothetical protein
MEENPSFLELKVDQQMSATLAEVSRWGKFLAVLVIVAIGLFFLMVILLWGRLAGQFLTLEEIQGSGADLLMAGLIVVFAIVGAIVGILMSFLIKAANRIRSGMLNQDQLLFNSGLANLKNYFAMYGVLGILGLLFTFLGLLFN